MTRTGWLAALALLALAFGVAARLSWSPAAPSLDCDPAQVRWVEAGNSPVATCAPRDAGEPAAERPAGPSLALGVKLELNPATEEELQ